MLKEAQELVSFILALLSNMRELGTNATLSVSPSLSLGVERTKALQLTAVLLLVVLSMFNFTLSAAPPQIDLLPFSLGCLFYFILAASVIEFAMRIFQRANNIPRLVKIEATQGRAFDRTVDSHSYVLNYNLIALFLFTAVREIAVYSGAAHHIRVINWIAAFIAGIVGSIVLLMLHPARNSVAESTLNGRQKVMLCVLLSGLFLGYTQILVR